MMVILHIIIGLAIFFVGGNMLYCHAQDNSIVLIADPRVLQIPIIDNQEAMIDLKKQKVVAYGPSPEIPDNQDYTKLRKTVYDKLIQAQALLPKGLHFCLYEGYRSLNLQKILFDNRFKKLLKQHADWPRDKIFIETTKLVSPVVNLDGSKNIPPHSTGGAIDIYLINDQGEAVDMGIHPKDWIDDMNDAVSVTSSTRISKVAQENRKIMSNVLSKVGFTNYPTEYWHWSYGDRYWAYHNHESHAIYDSVK